MNIKRALKDKNKLVSTIKDSTTNMQKFNSVIEGSVRPYDPKESLDTVMASIDQLVELKAKIHRANSKVYDKIFRLAELKSLAKQLKQMDCTEGAEQSYRSENPIVKNVIINTRTRDEIVAKLEVEIENLQEELDAHNAKAKI